MITDEPRIRAATVADVPAIADIVNQAYRQYIASIGKPPGPMLDDYAARVSESTVWVLEEERVIAAIIVLLPALDHHTHQTMVENRRLYASIGYEETGRGTEAGYDRVFMRKQLRG